MSYLGAARGHSQVARILLIPLILVLAACGDGESGADEKAPIKDTPIGLVVTKPDGSKVEISDLAAECGPSDYDSDVQVVKARAEKDGTIVLVEVVPADVEGGRSFELPVSAGADTTGPENALVYVGAEPNFESSTAEEEATGTLQVIRASCDPVVVEFTVDADLGSELSDVEGLNVAGHLKSS